MGWMKVTLSNADAHQGGKWKALQDAFEARFMAAGAPETAAMFHNHDHETNRFYFSPGSVEMFGPYLDAFGAVETEHPPREGLGLLVGHADKSWRLIESA